ncbi:sensor histidine kinase [Kitasatospora griseola]|uniref:sensor histidine kinase n=1 Tax=Kitasatospora griseola TaxID=2064 RepID=UPI00198979BF|nr:sensor histidine kinase [Kitasatospora griseola]GGQ84447.1 two-component sensor histidine kinase [Kitasatospora griseola]
MVGTETVEGPGSSARPARHRTGERPTTELDPDGRRSPRLPPAARVLLSSVAPGSLLVPLFLVLLLLHVVLTRGRGELVVASVLTVALVLPLVWLRRAPVVVFATVVAAAFVQWWTDVQLPADAALLVALYAVAADAGRRAVFVACAVVEGGALLACLRWATPGAFLAPFAALTAVVVAAAALGVNARTARAFLVASQERAARLEQQRDQQARLAVAEERSRIAREMHDIVTHNLSVMVALTDAALHARDHAPEAAATAMLRASETGRQALVDMRRSLGVLRSDGPGADGLGSDGSGAERRPLPGIGDLQELTERMCAAGLPTVLDLRGAHHRLPATAQLTVYRLVQEALTNTLKHAPAGARAEVRLQCRARSVTVDVTDDGPRTTPPRPAAASGHGIPGMRERAAAYRGTLRAGPLPGGGWHVHARLFLDSAEAATA